MLVTDDGDITGGDHLKPSINIKVLPTPEYQHCCVTNIRVIVYINFLRLDYAK